MASYGFKLFKLELMNRDGRTPQPWTYDLPAGGGSGLRLDQIEELVSDHISATERGLPLGPDVRPLSESERKQRPVFQVEDVNRTGTDSLLIRIRYGRHKDEDKGLPATDGSTAEVDLTDIAPTRSYRVGIFAPSAGTTGMMTVEAISGACPSRYFIKWIRRWALDKATDPTTGSVDDAWQKLSAHAAMDPLLLRRYVNQSAASSAVLVQRAVGSSRLRSDERFRIEASVFSSQSESVMKLAEEAIVAQDDEANTDATYAAHLAEILGKDDLTELDFDDGWVVVETASGRQQISPSRVPEIFVYPIDNSQPSDRLFRVETKKEIIRVRRSVGATLELDGW